MQVVTVVLKDELPTGKHVAVDSAFCVCREYIYLMAPLMYISTLALQTFDNQITTCCRVSIYTSGWTVVTYH